MRYSTETTNMSIWQTGWTLVPSNSFWGIAPALLGGTLLSTEPPAANNDFWAGEAYDQTAELQAQGESAEDIEDLADLMKTKLKYESEGDAGFIRHSEYRERRSRVE